MTFQRWKAIDAAMDPAWTGTSVKRLVLVDLIRRCDHDGTCYPSLGTIAAHTKVSRRAVYRALDELESDTSCPVVLRRIRRRKPGATQNDTNSYALRIRPRDSRSPGVGTHSPQGRDSGARGRDSQSPDPLMIPSGDHERESAPPSGAGRQASAPSGGREESARAITTPEEQAMGARRSSRRGAVPKNAEPTLAPLPAEWRPTDAHYQAGIALGFDRAEVDGAAIDFRLHVASNGWTSASWEACFEQWLRKRATMPLGTPRRSSEAAKPRPGGSKPLSAQQQHGSTDASTIQRAEDRYAHLLPERTP